MDLAGSGPMFAQLWKRNGAIYHSFFGTLYKNIPQGAATTLFCALNPETERGQYYADCAVERTIVHERINDQELMTKLWDVSEKIVKGK
jgi:hypothetical protein